MEWKIELIGNKEILNELSKHYSPYVTVIENNGNYLMSYKKVNSISNPRVVEKEVDEFLKRINSYLEIAFNYSDNKISYENFYYNDVNGYKQDFSKITVHVKVQPNMRSAKDTIQGVTTETHNPLSKFDDWIELTDTEGDEHAKRISDILNEPNSLVQLYKIRDVLTEDEHNPMKEEPKYNEQVEIFKEYVNTYEISKEEARHAKTFTNNRNTTKVKQKPKMTLDEANTVFKTVLNYWIEQKRKQLLEKR